MKPFKPSLQATDLHRYLLAACYARVHFRAPELNDFPPELHPDHSSLKNALSKGCFDDRFRVQMANRPTTTITSHIAKGRSLLLFTLTKPNVEAERLGKPPL
jgi:hypothetical protein